MSSRQSFFAGARFASILGSVLVGISLSCCCAVAFADEVETEVSSQVVEGSLAGADAPDRTDPSSEVPRGEAANGDSEEPVPPIDKPSEPEEPRYAPGWNRIDGGTYYADAQGALVTGWVDVAGARYYCDPDRGGAVVRGFADIDGSRYFFDGAGVLSKGWIKQAGTWYYASKSGALNEGWLKLGTAWYYLDPEAEGAMKTGSYKVDGVLYHARDDGSLVAGDGWVRDGGSWYWAASSGALKAGWLKRGSTWYFLDRTTGAMHTGWYLDGSTWYYSSGSGAMRSDGWFKQGSTWYYLTGSGAMKTGWLKSGSTWYFLDRESGAMRTGWYLDGSTWYWSDASGAMRSGGWFKQGSTWYYLSGSGAMRTGWLKQGSTWYFLDKTTGAMRTGWYLDGTTWYYSDGSGAMRSGGWFKQGSKWYYLEGSGAMHTGWLQLGSTRYYLDPTSGAMATGVRDIDGSRYWFESSGALQTGCWKGLGNGTCGYIGSTGAIAFRGAYDASGRIVAEDGTTGWVTIEGKRFYFDPSQGGTLRTGWISLDGIWYYADGQGVLQTGWVKTGGRWYYLSGTGAMKTGWLKLGSSWYYLDAGAGGAMRAGGWSWVGSVDYKFASSGRMVGAWVDVPCMSQYPQLPDGCESVALTNLLRFYGYGLSKTTIASDYLARSGSNFVTAYAGDPFSSGGSYQACAAPAIVSAGNLYLGNAGGRHRVVDATGLSQGSIYARLSEGTPVEVWNTVNAAAPGPRIAQQSHGGRTYSLFLGNHAVVVKGYDEERGIVYVADSISGDVERDADGFFSIYRQLGSQAVMVQAA